MGPVSLWLFRKAIAPRETKLPFTGYRAAVLTYNSGDFAAFFCNGAKLRRVAGRISNRFLSHSLQFCTVAVHIVVHVSSKSYPSNISVNIQWRIQTFR